MLQALLPRHRDSHSSVIRRPQPGPSRTRVQPKLLRGSVAGAAERDADAMADRVMAGQAVATQGRSPDSQEQGSALLPQVAQSLVASKGGGAPLAEGVRRHMEPRFGFDFADVRVHTDERAHAMTKSLSARAFAHGSDIYLAPQVRPEVNAVLAHELAHVTQQTGMVHCLHDEPLPSGVVRQVEAAGTQNYQGDADTSNPKATLYENDLVVGSHYKADGDPVWEFHDGSKVVGDLNNKKPIAASSRKASDVAWLDIPVNPAKTTLPGVKRIKRIETRGGSAPTGYGGYICGVDSSAKVESVAYTCVYEFCK